MPLRTALVQMNATVGDVEGNARAVLERLDEARSRGAALVVFPELVLAGYPPEDLLFHPRFLREQERRLGEVAARVGDEAVFVGFARRHGGALRNAAALLHRGAVAAVYDKIHLPNYGVFDEKRYFEPGASVPVARWGGLRVGWNICEDIWPEGSLPWLQCRRGGAHLVVNLSASPFHRGKRLERRALLANRARSMGGYLAYANLVSGQDELVFDGGSLVCAPTGEILAEAPSFREDILVVDLPVPFDEAQRPDGPGCHESPYPVETVALEGAPPAPPAPAAAPGTASALSDEEEAYEALVLGTRDYVEKNGFRHVVLGVSGGVDSALVASVAVDALGPDRVHGLAMPSRYSSEGSLSDARALARHLGFSLEEASIEGPFEAFLRLFGNLFPGLPEDLTEENIQARIRGSLLMALSNKRGWLVLTTGNKSEVSVGYCTLYGDTAGAFAVLCDVFKTEVYRLCRWRNGRAGAPWIPVSILDKAPSAELRPGQEDRDVLPPYDVLDPILSAYVEKDLSVQDIVSLGYDAATVRDVVNRVNASEFKRRQLPPGVKITGRSFGRDRRMPITSRYRA